MGRGIFGKKKSKTSSPATQSPREQTGPVPEGDGQLSADPNASPSSDASQGTPLGKSFSMPAKSTPTKTSRSSSLGHGSGGTSAESGMFTEQLQRLRARLQSVVQGVRDVAQSLDEPHSLISNVRDQLQTRQDAAAARRSSVSNSSPRTSNASAPAAAASAPLARVSGGSLVGGGSFRRGAAATTDTSTTPFAALAATAADPHGGTAAAAPDGVAAAAAAAASGFSVKARVAAVEDRSRSSGGGGISESLPTVSELRASTGGRTETELPEAVSVVENGDASPRGSSVVALLSASRSFGSGRRLGGGSVTTADEATQGGVSSGGGAAELRHSRPSSGIWPRVIIPPAVVAPSSYPSTVAAAAAAPASARSHALFDEASGSRKGSVAGAADAAASAAAAAVLAAADVVAADAAGAFGVGDDGLLAATANPAAAVAYLREHPETLRELWTLRARVRTQEGDLSTMVTQLSSKNAQLDQAQSCLQVKEKELGGITQRLTTVLSKLHNVQTAAAAAAPSSSSRGRELLGHPHPYPQQQEDLRGHDLEGQQQQLRESLASAGGGDGGGGLTSVPSLGAVMMEAAATPPPPAEADGGGDAAADAASSSVLSTSSTPQTPQRSALVAKSSGTTSASRFAAVKAALLAEQEAMAPLSPPSAEAAELISDTKAALRSTGDVLSAMPSAEASATSTSAAASATPSGPASVGASTAPSTAGSLSPSPERRQPPALRAAGSLDVYMPPPPRMPASGGASTVTEQAVEEEEEEEAAAAAREEEAATAAPGESSPLPSAVAAAAAPLLGGDTGSCVTPPGSGGCGVPTAADTDPAVVAEAREMAEAVREVSALQLRVREQEQSLEMMVRELHSKSCLLTAAEVNLVDREHQLETIRQRLAQLQTAERSQPEPLPELQPQPEPARTALPASQPELLSSPAGQLQLAHPGPAGTAPQLSQSRPLRGLLRVLLLQLGPSLVCVGMLLRNATGVQQRLQQLRRGSVGGAVTHAPQAQLLRQPQPMLPQRPQQSNDRVVEEVGRVSRLRRRVMKAVAAAASAARVRSVGMRRSRPTPEVEVEEAPLSEGGLHGVARLQCKSHWCQIIRPPPKDVIYY